MMRRLAELDRIDALHGLGADPRQVPAPRKARHRRDALLAGLLTAVVLSGGGGGGVTRGAFRRRVGGGAAS